ncbi:MAG: NAD(P)-dependent oxidoreductase [Peptoniphilaceae bacterium]|nr:NAD(P)-dependent oxidoreductase [Peptoniphilaceae bacterium]MDD7383828.1 NAD(P)-dependent oxidoreductase [Peptoniphilaceae bacterium]MDY3737595.1 NAD(P)-dependent oxidoreductase [Peptoniphilaceae bacterium]
MFKIKRKLKEFKNKGEKIKIALLGCGKMGSSLLSQISNVDGMDIVLVIDHTSEKARKALINSGISEDKIIVTNDIKQAREAIDKGFFVVSENYKFSYKLFQIQALVDCTGNPPFGAEIATKAIQYHKHIISLNVECDAVVGPILLDMAKKAGVIYTGSAGDEPGAIIDLCDFAMGAGFDVLFAAKGKNNPLDRNATPDSLKEEALSKGLSPRMLTSFVDGTNTMVELNAVCNCLGFLPDIDGCYGIETNPKNATEDYKLEINGGVFESYNRVDFSPGMAPGVFLIVTSDKEEVKDTMKYLGYGDGPNYLLFRPYHLTSLETPISIYNAIIENEATIAPIQGQVADTITIAKRDIKKGEKIDGIGSDKVYGLLVSHDTQQNGNLLPISLIDKNTTAKVDIKKSTRITYDMVNLDEESTIYVLRRKQDSMKL